MCDGEGLGLIQMAMTPIARHLRLSDAGLLLHRHAARILGDVSEADNAVGVLIAKPSGTLCINVGFTFADGPLAPMLPVFLSRYPEVRVVGSDLVEGRTGQALSSLSAAHRSMHLPPSNCRPAHVLNTSHDDG